MLTREDASFRTRVRAWFVRAFVLHTHPCSYVARWRWRAVAGSRRLTSSSCHQRRLQQTSWEAFWYSKLRWCDSRLRSWLRSVCGMEVERKGSRGVASWIGLTYRKPKGEHLDRFPLVRFPLVNFLSSIFVFTFLVLKSGKGVVCLFSALSHYVQISAALWCSPPISFVSLFWLCNIILYLALYKYINIRENSLTVTDE